jgi:hypothetical protein
MPTPTDTETPAPTDTQTPTSTPLPIPLIVVASADVGRAIDQLSDPFRRDQPVVDLRVDSQQPGTLVESLSPDFQADVLAGNIDVIRAAIDRGLVDAGDVQPLGCPVSQTVREFQSLISYYIAPTRNTPRRDLALAYIESLLSQIRQKCPPPPTVTPTPQLRIIGPIRKLPIDTPTPTELVIP